RPERRRRQRVVAEVVAEPLGQPRRQRPDPHRRPDDATRAPPRLKFPGGRKALSRLLSIRAGGPVLTSCPPAALTPLGGPSAVRGRRPPRGGPPPSGCPSSCRCWLNSGVTGIRTTTPAP